MLRNETRELDYQRLLERPSNAARIDKTQRVWLVVEGRFDVDGQGRARAGLIWFNDEAVRGAEPPVAASGWVGIKCTHKRRIELSERWRGAWARPARQCHG